METNLKSGLDFKQRYGRELNLSGVPGIPSLLAGMAGRVAFSHEAGGVRVRDAARPASGDRLAPRPAPAAARPAPAAARPAPAAARPAPAAARPAPAAARPAPAAARPAPAAPPRPLQAHVADDDDALPGIDSKTLQSYIPQPRHNGETVQFGDVFGIFRNLVEADDLSETQAIEIPETPVPSKHMSRLKGAVIVPESPDISDKDDSYIVPSQPKGPQKTLQSYIPQPRHNGETVQFGDVFGIFRNLVEADDLSETQAIQIPETPVPSKHMSRLKGAVIVPESPDISDKDDSYIVPSQPKGPQVMSTQFVKHARIISILPVESNRIDNVYWISSKKSISLNFDDSTVNLNDSLPPINLNDKEKIIITDIHELATQLPPGRNLGDKSTDSIFAVDTRIPKDHDTSTINTLTSKNCMTNYAVHNAMLKGKSNEIDNASGNIYELETQLPPGHASTDSILNVNTQMPDDFQGSIPTQNVQLCKSDAEKHNLNTQLLGENLPEVRKINAQQDMQFDLCAEERNNINTSSPQVNSNKHNLSNDIETSNDEVFFDNLEETFDVNFESQAILTEDIELPINQLVELDFEPISQIVQPKSAKKHMRILSDDLEPVHNLSAHISKKKIGDDDSTDCEEDNVIELKTVLAKRDVRVADTSEDLPTKLAVSNEAAQTADTNDVPIEEMPTQVIINNEYLHSGVNNDVDLTEIIHSDIASFVTIRAKKRDGPKKLSPQAEKYYDCTQDIHDDLFTQKLDLEETKSINEMSLNKEKSCHGRELSLKHKVESHHVSNQESLEIAGESNQVDQLKRTSSDSSIKSLNNTPKKQRPLKLTDRDLPDSQEIKKSVSQNITVVVNLSSSDSEPEKNRVDQCSPILYCKKQKSIPGAKLNLIAKFNPDVLPTRVITRVRNPTPKNKEHLNKKTTEILKPACVTEQDSDVDKDIIIENITRLKSKHEKSRSTHESFQLDKSGNTLTNEKPVEIMAESETDKKMRSCRRKATELNSKSKAENVKETDEPKINESKKHDTRNNRKYTDSKTEIPDKNARTKINPTSTRVTTPVEEKRSLRSRNAKTTRTKEKSPEKDPQTEKHKRKYTRNTSKSTNVEKTNPPSEAEVPKRKRGRPTKEDVRKQAESSTSKGIATKKPDQSVVYDLALSLGSKRHCLDDIDVPTVKPLRSDEFDLCAEERNNINTSSPQVNSNKHNLSNDIETSNDEVFFDNLEETFDVNFESQAILTEDIELPINQLVELDFELISQIVQPKSAKKHMRILSDDLEPVHNLSAHISKKKMGDDDSTDCEEDNTIELKTVLAKRDVRVADTSEDLPTKLAVSNEAVSPQAEKYYDCTQDIHDDLFTQKLDLEETKSINEMSLNKEKSCHGRELSLKHKVESHHVSNQESLEIAGESNQVDQLKRTSSDSSIKSLNNTPKKQRPLKLTDRDLPDSQEIKKSVSQNITVVVNLSSSDSEPEKNRVDQCSPILYCKKQKSIPGAKLNLIAKFNPDVLPTRVITRVRNPTPKNKEHLNKKTTEILKPACLTEQDSDVDKDIIIENITRLKSKHEKSRSTHESFQLDKSGNTLTNEKPVEIMAESETDKKMRSCRRKATELNSKSKAENVKETDEPKINESKKHDTRNNRKYTDSKTEIPDKNARTKINPTSTRVTTPVEEKRSLRSRNAKTTRTKEKSPEKDPQTEKHKRKYTRNTSKSTNVEKTNPPSEAEVPKRKRGRPTKEDVRKQAESSTSKGSATKKPDQSLVYDLALSLGSKRHCLDDIDVPTVKPLRSNVTPVETSSIRATETQYMIFTDFNAQEVGQKLEVLGVETVTDVTKCSVVITKCLRGTFKLLCAIGLGKPIVGPEWVQACVDHKCVVDPWQYLIKDEVAEQRFHCSLERTLKGKRNFLKGYNITSTPSVVPKAEKMKLIVECSGGRWGSGGSHWVSISCPQDSALWPDLRRRGATIANSKFILVGVMQQQIYLNSICQ